MYFITKEDCDWTVYYNLHNLFENYEINVIGFYGNGILLEFKTVFLNILLPFAINHLMYLMVYLLDWEADVETWDW